MRKVVLGLVVGLLIGMAGTALASNNFIQAQYAKFNIQINDNEAIEVEAVVVDGVSNYPIRTLMDLLGNEVDWNGKTRTILITTPEVETSQSNQVGDDVVIIDDTIVKPMPEYTPTDPKEYTSIAAINDRLAVLEALRWAFGEVSGGINYTAEQKKIAQDVIAPIMIEDDGLRRQRDALEYQSQNADRIAEEKKQRNIEDLNRKISKAERDIEYWTLRVSALNKSIAAEQEQQRDGWEQRVADDQVVLAEFERKLTDLQTELADLQAQLADLQ